jgi:hypothetical protein
MAAWYVRSAATGTGVGTSWTNAATTLQAAVTLGSAGDSYYVSEDHAETGTAALTITFKGTAAAIDQVPCVNHAGSVPPVSADLRTSATITTTGTSTPTITLTGGYAFIDGVTISVRSGATSATISLGGMPWLYFKNCGLVKAGTTASVAAINFVGSTVGILTLDNTTVKFGATTDDLQFSRCRVIWKNTVGAVQGSIAPTYLFNPNGTAGSVIKCDGVDFSAMSGKTLMAPGAEFAQVDFINCELPSSVTIAGTPTSPDGVTVTVQNSNSSAANYRNEKYLYQGSLTTDATNTLAIGAASDGTTPISWKVVTTANVTPPAPFETFAYAEWIDGTGLSITRTFEIANTSSLTLQNTDVWCEAQYLGSGSFPIASLATTGGADPLATGANLTSSSATWNGLTTPTTQKIAITFTNSLKGYYRLAFKVARASTTVWINPRPNEV